MGIELLWKEKDLEVRGLRAGDREVCSGLGLQSEVRSPQPGRCTPLINGGGILVQIV